MPQSKHRFAGDGVELAFVTAVIQATTGLVVTTPVVWILPTAFDIVLASATGSETLRLTGSVVAVGVSASALAMSVGRLRTEDRRHASSAAAFSNDPDAVVLSLVETPYTTVEETHRRLRALERYFRVQGDRRAVFLTVYARVTGAVARAVERSAFENPDWVARYLVTFANFYRRAVYNFERGRLDAVPTAWVLAFRAAEREETFVLQHAALGINAHVTFDLAFALFAVGVGEDQRPKYRDHQRINLVLWQLVDVTLDRLAERYAPGIATIEELVGPLLKLSWFGALVVGREVAWWAARIVTEAPGNYAVRAVRYLVAIAATVVASAILGPTFHPSVARVIDSTTRRIGVRGI